MSSSKDPYGVTQPEVVTPFGEESNDDLSLSLNLDEIELDLSDDMIQFDGASVSAGSDGGAWGEDPVIGKMVGNFRILRKIGKGGFGAVYLAEQIFLEAPFAVKVLPIHLMPDPETVKRFQREAQALFRLRHDKIVQLSDFGILPDIGLYLVMEYLDGNNLQDCIRTGEDFPIERIRMIISHLCEALDYIHRKGIVHRDLKPGNIFLVQEEDEAEKVKLIDFGIAALLHDNDNPITQKGTYVGTAKFISPEQVRGRKILDGRSDLYALGVILYYLLTGRTPFEEGSAVEIVYNHVHSPPPPLSEVAPETNWAPELQSFVNLALAKSPDERPPDAQSFASMCDEALVTQSRLSPVPALSSQGSKSQHTVTPSARDRLIEAIASGSEGETRQVRKGTANAATSASTSAVPSSAAASIAAAVESGEAVSLVQQIPALDPPPAPSMASTNETPMPSAVEELIQSSGPGNLSFGGDQPVSLDGETWSEKPSLWVRIQSGTLLEGPQSYKLWGGIAIGGLFLLVLFVSLLMPSNSDNPQGLDAGATHPTKLPPLAKLPDASDAKKPPPKKLPSLAKAPPKRVFSFREISIPPTREGDDPGATNTRPNPTNTRPNPTGAQPPPPRPTAKRPTPRRRAVSRRRRRRRRRTRRRRRRRVNSRIARLWRRCRSLGRRKHWVYARSSAPRKPPKVSFLRCRSCIQRRYSTHVCLGLPPNKTVKVRVYAARYQACEHTISSKTLVLRWKLKRERMFDILNPKYPCAKLYR